MFEFESQRMKFNRDEEDYFRLELLRVMGNGRRFPFAKREMTKTGTIPNNSKQLRPRSRAIFTLDWRRFTVRLWIIPVARAEAQPPLLHRTLTFIVIQVNTPAPCCGNSQNPSVTEDSFVSSALPATFCFHSFATRLFLPSSPHSSSPPLGHSNVFFREKRCSE